MKILITTGIYPPDIGGPARMIEKMAEELSNNNFKIEILTFGDEGLVENGKYKVFKVSKKKSKISQKIKYAFWLFRLAKKSDLIYTFDLYTAGFFSWLIGKIILRKKLVVRFAGDSAWEIANNRGYTSDDILNFQNKFYGIYIAVIKKFRNLILRGADKVVCVSEFMGDLAEKIGVAKNKIEVIYNSVEFLDFSNKSKNNLISELDLPTESKIIVTAGRLVPWKGVAGLIKSLKIIKNTPIGKNLKLLVIGDGPELENLKKLAGEEGVLESVHFTGLISLNKVIEYYKLADVFVLNSNYEGLSHTLLEVLSLGIPVVASNVGGNPELVENNKNGVLISYNDLSAISSAIVRILTEEKWKSDEYKKECAKILEKFTWKNNIEKTINLLKNIYHEQSTFN
ncbi:MAG: Glycosyltransferase [Candidatus Magasanikbacteria bacterium GW2011_GWC2_37_14]|uniref:Glycosyltransferase n=1 Tax=Candidatus Magasanikbacteria bacterium GW2011_GWC2_37_14 TaxID=1619046 RepID=A0A0G0GP03_9BACT|nr:MAG: Glycosyltransferase [Candidatus Magasanikbacteria bacterium GW2011_GWC2_37_14]